MNMHTRLVKCVKNAFQVVYVKKTSNPSLANSVLFMMSSLVLRIFGAANKICKLSWSATVAACGTYVWSPWSAMMIGFAEGWLRSMRCKRFY